MTQASSQGNWLRRGIRLLLARGPEQHGEDWAIKSSLLGRSLLVVPLAAITLLIVLINLEPALRSHADIQIGFIASVLFLGLYGIYRIGYYRLAATLFVAVALVSSVSFNHVPGESSPETIALVVLPVLLASYFFSPRTVLVVTGLQLASIIGLPFLMPALMSGAKWYATVIVLILDAALIANVYHQINLERHRHAELERRVGERTTELEGMRQELASLYRVSREINQKTQYIDIIRSFAQELGAPEFDVVLGVYDQFDQAVSEHLQIVATLEAGSTTVRAGQQSVPIFMNGSAVQVLIHTGSGDDPPLTAPQRAFMERMGAAAMMAVPVAIGQRVVGAIITLSRTPRPWTEFQQRTLFNMADLAAGAIERVRLLEEVNVALQAAMQASQLKSQFLASTSHELRTPLNAIINFTQFVSSGLHGPVNEKQVDALEKATSSARHLLSLINDILDMSKIEAGRMELHLEDGVDLVDEINTALSTVIPLLEEKGLALNLDLADDLPPLTIDSRRIRQVLINILSNAAKFTDSGQVDVRATLSRNEVQISICDTGPGIPPDQQEVIFEPFRQLQRDRQVMAGTGLGLPISRRLVEAHGGRLWVESTPGEGATFTLALPIEDS